MKKPSVLSLVNLVKARISEMAWIVFPTPKYASARSSLKWEFHGICWKYIKLLKYFFSYFSLKKYSYLYNFCQSIDCWLIIFVHHEILHFSQCLLKWFNACVQSVKSIWKIKIGKLIVIFYSEILTRKVVLWCFFMSETSEKIHNSTFRVKISV